MGSAVKTKGQKIYKKPTAGQATHFVLVTHPQHTSKITSKIIPNKLFCRICVYSCFKLWKLENKKNMPCLPLCRLNLSIVQNRYVRTWIMSTINLLENSAGLYQFTLELPWPGFTPESITYLIRQFNEYHASVHNRIQSLTRMSASGCSLCRSRQRQAQNPQHWLGTRSSPWN